MKIDYYYSISLITYTHTQERDKEFYICAIQKCRHLSDDHLQSFDVSTSFSFPILIVSFQHSTMSCRKSCLPKDDWKIV